MAEDQAPRLLDRDREVLDAVLTLLGERGYPPTVRELAAHLGYRAPQSVQRRLDRLVAAGRLRRDQGRLRALAPTTTPAPPGMAALVATLPPDDGADAARSVLAWVPIPTPDLLAAGEICVALVAAADVRDGPRAGDWVYCVPGRAPAVGDLVVVDGPDGNAVVRWLAAGAGRRDLGRPQVRGHTPPARAVVVGWFHRA